MSAGGEADFEAAFVKAEIGAVAHDDHDGEHGNDEDEFGRGVDVTPLFGIEQVGNTDENEQKQNGGKQAG